MAEVELETLLLEHFPGATLRSAHRLTGGVSADVFKLEVTLPEAADAALVLRVHGATHGGHPAPLEHALLKALCLTSLPVPRPLGLGVTGSPSAHPYLFLEFMPGTSAVPADAGMDHIDQMAAMLARIHEQPTDGLPELPLRRSPLPELMRWLPLGARWAGVRAQLAELTIAPYAGPHKLLHGDFWPENLLWVNGTISAVLDWEDAAFGDPASDVAGASLELAYLYGAAGAQRFQAAYAERHGIDRHRLTAWLAYVAAAAQHFMGRWGLPPEREAHMRGVAQATLRDAAAQLG